MGISDNALPVLLIILGINLMLFLGQTAITDINPGFNYYNPNGSMLCKYDANNCQGDTYHIIDDDDGTLNLPESEAGIDPTTGNIFTDSFTSIKSWFTQTTGLNYLTGFLFAPANFLKSLPLPDAFQWALGALWYGVTLLVIIALLWGR